jgi:hypothetical protein
MIIKGGNTLTLEQIILDKIQIIFGYSILFP